MKKCLIWLCWLFGLGLMLGVAQPVHAAALSHHQLTLTQQWYRDPQGVIGTQTQTALYDANYHAFQAIQGKPQIAVIVTSGQDMAELQAYAKSQFNHYGFGHQDWNNGLLVVIEPHERHYWIEVGSGLTNIISSDNADEIVASTVKNQLRHGQYDDAIASIVKHSVQRVQRHASEITTPAQIATKRKWRRWVTIMLKGLLLVLLLIAVLVPSAYLWHWLTAKRVLTQQPDTFPILRELKQAGITLTWEQIPNGGGAIFSRQKALVNAMAKLIRRDYVQWLAAAPQLAPEPYYYYKVTARNTFDISWPALELTNQPAAELATAPSLAAILTDQTSYSQSQGGDLVQGAVALVKQTVGRDQSRYEAWLASAQPTPNEASFVWHLYAANLRTQSQPQSLSDEKLAELWTVILTHVRHPDVTQQGVTGMPDWVETNFVQSSASGGFGGSGGGGSAGGGFGGSW